MSVHLKDDSGSQVVEDQRLVRLGDAQLPRKPGAFDSGPTAGSSASVVPRYGYVLRFTLK